MEPRIRAQLERERHHTTIQCHCRAHPNRARLRPPAGGSICRWLIRFAVRVAAGQAGDRAQ